MNILAFDVSITGCAVGCLDSTTGQWTYRHESTDRGQAEILIPMIESVVQEAGITMKDIGCIAVTQGPGSFTGVRIGLATARTLGLALNIPVCGLSTLELLRMEYGNDALLLIDTKRSDYYGQTGIEPSRIWSPDEVAAFTGTIIKDAFPDLRLLARYAGERQLPAGYDSASAPTPIYLRDAEVSQPKKLSPFAS